MGQLNTRERARAIRATIREEEQRLRQRYAWLQYQDLLGLVCFVCSIAAIVAVAALYLRGRLSGWGTIPVLALLLSVLHEIEHDLIHDQYFRRHRWVQNGMYSVIWFLKQGLNPWYRRDVHLKHHRFSGQPVDIEERLIGLGLPFGFMRVFVAMHPLGSLFLFEKISKEAKDFQPLRLFFLSLPTYGPFLLLTYAALLYGIPGLFGDPFLILPEWGWPIVRDLSILILLPNTLRQFCLVLMSTYSHYYEDIPNEVYYQNQILRGWYLWPFQLFCFNFGSTHIIHHYVINQPFYLRQMVARAAHAAMTQHGVRVNDLGTVTRANRWGEKAS
jgi:fatty acid desaturase